MQSFTLLVTRCKITCNALFDAKSTCYLLQKFNLYSLQTLLGICCIWDLIFAAFTFVPSKRNTSQYSIDHFSDHLGGKTFPHKQTSSCSLIFVKATYDFSSHNTNFFRKTTTQILNLNQNEDNVTANVFCKYFFVNSYYQLKLSYKSEAT